MNEQLAAESTRIQMELERLKTRRRMIEEQRRALAAATPLPHTAVGSASHHNTTANANANNRSTSAAQMTSSFSDLTAATNVVTHSGDLPPGGTKRHAILPESKRRYLLLQSNNPHFQMKEAIKQSLLHDSTIVSGTFMPNPHASKQGSFGRAARFSAPQGVASGSDKDSTYYLSYDMQQLQGPKCRQAQRGQIITASSRGRAGANVNSHWNDPKGGVAPGPGAYTPRYWFCSNSK